MWSRSGLGITVMYVRAHDEGGELPARTELKMSRKNVYTIRRVFHLGQESFGVAGFGWPLPVPPLRKVMSGLSILLEKDVASLLRIESGL